MTTTEEFDYIIVGAGLFGATFARLACDAGKRCLVLERREHVGGNVYCENVDGITVHRYGPHIFHTSDTNVWRFVNKYAAFVPFINSPLACYKGQMYNLPFNMNTFRQLWGDISPEEAKHIIERQSQYAMRQMKIQGIEHPRNLEDFALCSLGADIYNTLIKGYTEKQWGRPCRDLPANIIKRLPVRYTFDNNYFADCYQGIPKGGYNLLIAELLKGIDVKTNTDFFDDKQTWERKAKCVVFTGRIDEYFGFCYGTLDYRTLRFEHQRIGRRDYQGNAVVNYTDKNVPFTRIVEHKHFEQFGNIEASLPYTIITREYSQECRANDEPFYPVNDNINEKLATKYRELAMLQPHAIFGGRLAEYRYYNMDAVIGRAIEFFMNY